MVIQLKVKQKLYCRVVGTPCLRIHHVNRNFMSYISQYVTIAFMSVIFFVSCYSPKKTGCNIPQLALRDTLTIDTTFLVEASGGFYAKEDILYTGPIALIKPDFTITERNYYAYKASTVNFLFGGGGVEYQILKAKYVNEYGPGSTELTLTEASNAKELIIGNNFRLLERKVKLKCFLIGIKNNQSIIDPSSNKPLKAEKIIYYGVYAVEE